MKAQLISLAALLAVLAGCPETPTDTAVDATPARKDAASASTADDMLAASQSVAIRDDAFVSAEPHEQGRPAK